MTDPNVAAREPTEDRLAPWWSAVNLSWPYWRDYQRLILLLRTIAGRGSDLPTADQLQQILPDHAVNQSGQAVSFLPGKTNSGIEYEELIFQTGEISTRENNWHDLFNALVWARFPRLKSAMNAAHHGQICPQKGSRRSRLRDALTLLDECGVIVVSANRDLLNQLAARDWHQVFRHRATCWEQTSGTHVFVCGHALLEKFLRPYKSLTAHAVLACVDTPLAARPRESLLQFLDLRLAEMIFAGNQFRSPADLSPLPLMGIPGWWPHGPQDQVFYADRQVFRQPPDGFRPAPLFDLTVIKAHQDTP